MKKSIFWLIGLGILMLSACTNPQVGKESSAMGESAILSRNDVSNWPQAVTYEIFVQSFADSDGDSIGDIKGMTLKLPYLQDLGVKAVWLMPMHPSPSYHKYDVTDYYDIHPEYGTLEDFKDFVKEAHEHDIKVVIDLVVNHTARDHPWFQEAMNNPNSPYRDYYVWADKDSIADQIAKKEVTLDSDNITQWHDAPGNSQSYYGFFWGGMPDLNFDKEAVRQEIFKIGRFWLEEVDVDGFRLDAARHIFPDDRPEDNHAWWQTFRAEMEKVKPDVYLIGEVWDATEEVAPYFRGLHALFNFDMSYAMTEAAAKAKGEGLVKKHQEIREFYKTVTPDFIDATFLTNHDQNRIMSELQNDLDKARMAAALLFTLPGSPYLYYGEEIGMRGKKPDENIREPFLWDRKENDQVRTKWIEPEYSTDDTIVPLALQQGDSSSLYHHYKKLIGLRNSSLAITFGELLQAKTEKPEMVIFRRLEGDEDLLILHNLSGASKRFELAEEESDYQEVFYSSEKGASILGQEVFIPRYSTMILKKI